MANPGIAPIGRGPLGHHQTEKEIWGVTNLPKEARLGFTGSIMIGETVASNLQNRRSSESDFLAHSKSAAGQLHSG